MLPMDSFSPSILAVETVFRDGTLAMILNHRRRASLAHVKVLDVLLLRGKDRPTGTTGAVSTREMCFRVLA